MNIRSYPLRRAQFFPERTEKRYVVWHGTAGRTAQTPASGRPGNARTSIDGWNADSDRTGAPWLVDRDGTIYSTFDDAGWIYHLGIAGTNARYDKQAVAIEFANEGPLEYDGDQLHAFGKITPNTIYKGPVASHDWRGARHFAELDVAQVDAGIALTLDICRRHQIEPRFFYPSTSYAYPRCFHVATILTHSNCRADKTDLYLPEWVFDKIHEAGIRLVS